MRNKLVLLERIELTGETSFKAVFESYSGLWDYLLYVTKGENIPKFTTKSVNDDTKEFFNAEDIKVYRSTFVSLMMD